MSTFDISIKSAKENCLILDSGNIRKINCVYIKQCIETGDSIECTPSSRRKVTGVHSYDREV